MKKYSATTTTYQQFHLLKLGLDATSYDHLISISEKFHYLTQYKEIYVISIPPLLQNCTDISQFVSTCQSLGCLLPQLNSICITRCTINNYKYLSKTVVRSSRWGQLSTRLHPDKNSGWVKTMRFQEKPMCKTTNKYAVYFFVTFWKWYICVKCYPELLKPISFCMFNLQSDVRGGYSFDFLVKIWREQKCYLWPGEVSLFYTGRLPITIANSLIYFKFVYKIDN